MVRNNRSENLPTELSFLKEEGGEGAGRRPRIYGAGTLTLLVGVRVS